VASAAACQRRRARNLKGAGDSSSAMTERVAVTVTAHGAAAGCGYRTRQVAAVSGVAGVGIA